jgi:acetyl-CoA C-acetyltransferase
MLALASEKAAGGKKPIAEILSIAAAAGNPAYGLAETGAVKKALEKAGVALPGLARIEIVEMSAVQVLATIKGLELDASDKRINPLGGGLAIGSPWGASGTVHLVDLIHGLKSGESGIVVNPAEGGQVMCVVVRKI